jgi:hypothetical protein
MKDTIQKTINTDMIEENIIYFFLAWIHISITAIVFLFNKEHPYIEGIVFILFTTLSFGICVIYNARKKQEFSCFIFMWWIWLLYGFIFRYGYIANEMLIFIQYMLLFFTQMVSYVNNITKRPKLALLITIVLYLCFLIPHKNSVIFAADKSLVLLKMIFLIESNVFYFVIYKNKVKSSETLWLIFVRSIWILLIDGKINLVVTWLFLQVFNRKALIEYLKSNEANKTESTDLTLNVKIINNIIQEKEEQEEVNTNEKKEIEIITVEEKKGEEISSETILEGIINYYLNDINSCRYSASKLQ